MRNTVPVSTGAIPQISTTNQTSENQESDIPYVQTVKPFTIQERNWFRDVYNTVGQMLDEDEMNLRMTP